MRRVGATLSALGAALVITMAGCGGGTSGAPKTTGPATATKPSALVADVGKNDAFRIEMTDQAGKPLLAVVPGTYRLTVHDESSIHDFHLTGPGVDISTGVGTTGTQTFTVTLRKGTYTYVCDPHSAQMHGSFTVT